MLWPACTPDAVFVDRHVAEKYSRENANTREVYEREKLLYYVMSVQKDATCLLLRSLLTTYLLSYYIFYI